jgi:hypothetical protein
MCRRADLKAVAKENNSHLRGSNAGHPACVLVTIVPELTLFKILDRLVFKINGNKLRQNTVTRVKLKCLCLVASIAFVKYILSGKIALANTK